MFKNYLKIALRNLHRFRTYSLINITGLIIGMACFILVFLYVQDELSYDRYHENSRQIYRITAEANITGQNMQTATTPAPLAPTLTDEFPEVLGAVRFLCSHSGRDSLIAYGEKKFYESRFLYADQNVFDIFSFKLIKGDPETALKNPHSIILTEEMAKKYFGNEDPLGKVMTVNNRSDFQITGVLRRIPHNSHFRFDFLASFATLTEADKSISQNWGDLSYHTYLLLAEGSSPVELESKLPLIVKKYVSKFFESYLGNVENMTSMFKFHVQPLTGIHLHSQLLGEIEANSDINYVYIFSAVAFFILIIACINFMNLATARSSCRAKEVGMRKVVGAQRSQLIGQFLGESFLLSFISLLLAIGLVEILLPAFNAISEKEISLNYSQSWIVLIGLVGMAFVVGFLSGSYPAFLLSSFRPIEVLRGKVKSSLAVPFLRKILVIFQFSVSVILITGTVVIRDQLIYIRNKNLGFDKEQLVAIPLRSNEIIRNYQSIKNELLQYPDIVKVSASSTLPGRGLGTSVFRPEGASDDNCLLMYNISVDYDFIKTLGIELLAGRSFSKDFSSDDREAFIINEAAVKKLGWKSPIGKQVEYISVRKGTVIGVVKDFHYLSLHQKIEPFLLYVDPEDFRYFAVKIRPQNISRTLAFLEDKWRKFDPAHPFEYSFLDDDFDKLYKADKKLGQIFVSFTALAIFIACLGLFGLTSFTAEQRTKEIGIRKVLGASVPDIIVLLSREFTKWVLAANLIAWPVAYYAMNRWLQNFAYRISISLWMFFLAASLTFVISLFTVSFQAVRAAVSNPVKALRYE
jgi:putative ABC transport system permease protein